MDKKFLKKLLQRHARTQRALYDIHCDRLMNIIVRYVRDIPYAEEVLQDTFIQIFDKIQQFDQEKGHFKNWSHKIAVNQALMKLRTINRNKFQVADLIESRNMINNQGLDNLNYEDLLEKVETLSPKQSALIKLRLIDGYEFQEISELLGISISNSRKILSRARNILSDKIETADHSHIDVRTNQL